jgi:2-amino-4-hydroxy-6-hydroxymethyldihydropteridine diphosphokinase
MKTVTSYLGLGSNLGNKKQNILRAINSLEAEKRIKLINKSEFYKTKPFGVKNQPDFINAAVKIKTSFNAESLLEFLLDTEKRLGRIRTKKWGPRIIDIDILYHGNQVIRKRNLIIPHLLMHKRCFVLKPLAEIAPKKVHPVLKRTSVKLLKELLNGNNQKYQ